VPILEKVAERTVCIAGETRPMCHCATLVQLPSGELCAAWYEGSYEMAKDSIIAGSTTIGLVNWNGSADPRFQWDEPKTLIDLPDLAVGNPVLSLGSDQTLWLFFVVVHGETWPSSRIALAPVEPEAVSSAPIPWPLELSICPTGFMTKNKAIKLSSGTILLPVYDERTTTPFVLRSADGGKSWRIYGETTTAYGCAEQPTLVELPTGVVFMLLRTNKGEVWKSYSVNQGLTWTSAEPTDLPNPNSGIDMVQTPKGRIVLVMNDDRRSRHRLVAVVSEDQGLTWGSKQVIHDVGAGEVSYPTIIKDRDGFLHLLYTYQRTEIRHVVFRET
jgi:predicted neuraminidase